MGIYWTISVYYNTNLRPQCLLQTISYLKQDVYKRICPAFHGLWHNNVCSNNTQRLDPRCLTLHTIWAVDVLPIPGGPDSSTALWPAPSSLARIFTEIHNYNCLKPKTPLEFITHEQQSTFIKLRLNSTKYQPTNQCRSGQQISLTKCQHIIECTFWQLYVCYEAHN